MPEEPRRIPPPSRIFSQLCYGFGLLCQVIKLYSLVRPDISLLESLQSCRRWMIFDVLYCIALVKLRLATNTVFLLLALLVLDIAMFMGSRYSDPAIPSIYEPLALLELLTISTFDPHTAHLEDSHLLGQHTIQISPVITAQLNPDSATYCIAPTRNLVFIPVLLDDANIVRLSYSFTPLIAGDKGYSHPENVHLTARNLKTVERMRLKEARRLSDPVNAGILESLSSTRKRSFVYIQLSKPGTLRLEHALYSQNIEARIVYPFEVTVVPCPRAEFVDHSSAGDDVRCSGGDSDVQLLVDVYGIPPLSLRWSKIVNGRREHMLIDGIERGGVYERSAKYDRTPAIGGDRAAGYLRHSLVLQDMRTALEISLTAVGTHHYVLDEIADAVGNVVHMDMSLVSTDKDSVSKSKTMRSFIIMRRPTAAFKDCSTDAPAYMTLGAESSLVITGNTSDGFSSGWEVTLKYQPPPDVYRGGRRAAWLTPWERTFSNQGSRKNIHVPAVAPGDYTIVMVKGKRCDGEVSTPDSCRVLERPPPTAEITWNRIQDRSGDKGISASLVMTGTPPFQVTYRVQREDDAPQELSKTFSTAKGVVDIRPSRSGHYIFIFIRIGDIHYQKIELQGPKIELYILEAAGAAFISGRLTPGSSKRLLDSCDSGILGVDVELRGTAPWTLITRVSVSGGHQLFQFAEIGSSPTTLDIQIPESVERDGGVFDVDLVSVEDARKYTQTLSTPGIVANIRKVKPTVRFKGEEHERVALGLEEESTNLPLVLTGSAPWRVKYRREEADNLILTAMLNGPSSNISVTQPGLYHIIDVVDAQCPGTIHPHASSYRVDWIPRPSAALSPSTILTFESFNRSYILHSTCQGVVEHVEIDLIGQPPFQVVYDIVEVTSNGAKLSYNPTYSSTVDRSKFQLQTSHVGRVYYEVAQIGDAAYPLAKHKSRLIPPIERLRFEQQVFLRPSAAFKTQGRLSYYLHDAFIASASSAGIIVLEGVPPFKLQLSIKNLATRQIDSMTVDVLSHTWKVAVPSYTFKTIGVHLVSIESICDASNYTHTLLLKSPSRSIFVDVHAGAAILPYDQRKYFCVKDTARFHLEGIAPWTIGYRINSKSFTKEVSASPFFVLLERHGDFAITSISQPHIRRSVSLNMLYTVYALPSATVAYGQRIYQDITEGDQAEIVFTLIGTPPFTFTYQRSELRNAKDTRPGNVLETHTVSHLTTNSFTISASIEGTWEVTSISDLHCHYP